MLLDVLYALFETSSLCPPRLNPPPESFTELPIRFDVALVAAMWQGCKPAKSGYKPQFKTAEDAPHEMYFGLTSQWVRIRLYLGT
jgi:hypothetical protein